MKTSQWLRPCDAWLQLGGWCNHKWLVIRSTQETIEGFLWIFIYVFVDLPLRSWDVVTWDYCPTHRMARMARGQF